VLGLCRDILFARPVALATTKRFSAFEEASSLSSHHRPDGAMTVSSMEALRN
jgi:hypothetical protein